MDLDVIRSLSRKNDSKVVLLVMDGLGGLPRESDGKTELEAAKTPNLDRLAGESICGLHEPIGPGITPGSGPAHLALFGYDPLHYQVGRGVLAAMGIDFDMQPGDVACRGNFCTVDGEGRVTDRRAGRISTEKNEELCAHLKNIELSEGTVEVRTIKEHRFLAVFRADGLSDAVADTDPQVTGREPLDPRPKDSKGEKTARLAKEFAEKAREVLRGQDKANMVLLRGFARLPGWPSFEEVYGTRAACIADYPMYRGLGRLLGMTALEGGSEPESKFEALRTHWTEFDFFFIHVKKPDKTGEDGDFDAKVEAIEHVDHAVPKLLEMGPDVLVVTGDHSTPWALANHGWQPVPALIRSAYARPDQVSTFGERACITGGLGPRLPGSALMPIAMANANRLEKFGA
ncbi:MAG: 2,3-bisphosphoglycerate-independent phosphoglycerate mutase [Spirochaetaceae bacterium]